MTVLWFLIISGLYYKGFITFCGPHSWTGFGTLGTLLYSVFITLPTKFGARGKD
jgi:hypothetical protein